MEIRVVLRGAAAGTVAGVLGFVFEHIFAEPQITRSIDYEYGRGAVLTAINHAAGRPFSVSDPEIFSRATQPSIGAATGIIGFAVAVGRGPGGRAGQMRRPASRWRPRRNGG